jgi:hypothetical protein
LIFQGSTTVRNTSKIVPSVVVAEKTEEVEEAVDAIPMLRVHLQSHLRI